MVCKHCGRQLRQRVGQPFTTLEQLKPALGRLNQQPRRRHALLELIDERECSAKLVGSSGDGVERVSVCA